MAINLSRGGGRRRRHVPLSEINMTPFIDVMLVLLIVFMVTAPLLTVGVPVDLPKTAAASLNDKVEPLVISVDPQGKIYLGETPISMEELTAKLQAIHAEKPDTTIFVRGDRTIAYGQVMQVMGQVAAAGLSKVSLIAEAPGTPAPGAPSAAAPVRR